MPIGEDGYPDWYQGPKTDHTTDSGVIDWFKGFGSSAAWSIPELIGINPSTETQQWRQEHPVGNFASQMLGLAVPYTGWFKAAKGLKSLETVAKGFEEGKGFLGGVAGTATRFAPFEAARIAAHQTVAKPLSHALGGEGTFSNMEMLGAAGTDLALSAGIGGVIRGIQAAGLRDPSIPSIFPGIDITLPLPLLARQMRSIIDSGALNESPEMLGRARGKLAETLNRARSEIVEHGDYIGEIAHDSLSADAKADQVARYLNRLYRSGDKEDNRARLMQVKKLAQSKYDYPDKATWLDEAKNAGLPDGFEEHGQYFRTISFQAGPPGSPGYSIAEKNATKRAAFLNDSITKNLQSAGDGNFWAREADDGMFLIAKKYEGKTNKADITDKWVTFKTDQPGFFMPGNDKWAKAQVAIGGWVPQQKVAADGGVPYNNLAGYLKNYPLHNWNVITGEGASAAKRLVGALTPQSIVGKESETIESTKEFANRYFVPRPFQFAFQRSARASQIMNAAKMDYDTVETTTNQLLNGTRAVPEGAQVYTNNLRGGTPMGLDGMTPIRQAIETAPENAKNEFMQKIWNKVAPSELAGLMTAGEITPETMKLAEQLEALRGWLATSTLKLENAVGITKPTQFPEKSYGMMKRWEGYSQFAIEDDAGNPVAKAGGLNRRQALANAQKLLAENPSWKLTPGGEIRSSGDPAGLPEFLRGARNEPLADAQNLRGHKWDLDVPTKKELVNEYEGQIRRVLNYQANRAAEDLLAPSMSSLMREDPTAYKLVQDRLADYAGLQSQFGKWQNRIADEIMGPMIGSNSASKIVATTGTAMFNWTLGALKMSYGVINGLQFVQTVAPEIAFVLGKALDADKAPFYSIYAAGGTNGPTGSMGVLNPVKMMGGGFRLMAKPPKELSEAYGRAVTDRVLEPRVVEDYIGASATRLTDLRKAFTSGEGFVGWLRAVSEFIPAETERLSRTHAFSTGWNIAKNFLRDSKGNPLSADAAYQFAREFTEKTMYLYGTADRSRIFTTPAGSMMGFFKNWMFHYMSSMLDYTRQGLARDNWSPLMWQMGGTFALGGAAALPIFGIANQVSKLWAGKDMLPWAYDHFGQHADGILYGLPSLMGVSMTSGVDTPALSNPVRDASSLFNVAAWGRMQQLGKTVGGAFDNWQATGQHPGTDRATRENLIKSFAPVTMYRSLSAFANPDQITSLGTGYPLQKNATIPQKLLYASGFTPLELQKGYDTSQALYETHESLKKAEDTLGKAWAEAEMGGDSAKMATIMRQGIVWGVDLSRVLKNSMYEIQKHQQDIIERHMRPKDIGTYRSVIQSRAKEQASDE